VPVQRPRGRQVPRRLEAQGVAVRIGGLNAADCLGL
jgi:hypothetical protein